MQAKVSVIIPIFKVERFIERNARFLFEQTLEDVEYIFVDDCTPDNSIAVLERLLLKFPHKKPYCTIVRHEVNKGLPTARNTGLANASGDYVFHCDSDDWIEKDALEKLYNKAQQDDADIVWCDWYLSFEHNERYMSQKPVNEGIQTGFDVLRLLLSGQLRYNVWNKLVKRSIYVEHAIQFPDGNGMGEDMTMIKLFAFADKVSYVAEALYHYVQLNEEAFTKKTTPQHLVQIRSNVDDVISFLETKYEDKLVDEIHFFKLNTKLPFLMSDDIVSFKRWLEWYPESNVFIDKNPAFNNRTKLIQKAAINQQFWLLKLYYRLVFKFVYGFFYK